MIFIKRYDDIIFQISRKIQRYMDRYLIKLFDVDIERLWDQR